jgi:hypothetical protein
MRIRWINHPNPKLQHLNGLIQHEPYEAVAPYILSGQAEELPFKTYQERLKYEEELRLASQPKVEALWGVKETLLKAMVVKTFNSEVFYYDSPPADCPPFIRQRWQFAHERIVGMGNDLNTNAGYDAKSRRDFARERNG